MEKKEQEVAEEYLSSLADLNLNSKPLINMLTILAEENFEFAPVIVKAVEQHIAKVNPEVKLPVLYLIDSIVKNVGREYIQLFSHSIVNIFCGVFEKVNEKIREKMYTLRQTWNDVFTPQKLYTLDVKVNCMDPNWPITAKVVPKSPAIHVNPIFLKNKSEPLNEMEAKLRDKQRQLLELQKRKLELELAATKQQLEKQEKQLQTTIIQTDTTKQPVISATGGSVQPNVPGKVMLGQFSKAQNKQQINAGSTNASTVLPLNTNVSKVRVAPVNPALLNSIRQRDPRLARQQQQQAAAIAQNLSNAEIRDVINMPGKSLDPNNQQLLSSDVQSSDSKIVVDSSTDKILSKSSSKSNLVNRGDRDRSKIGSNYSGSSSGSSSKRSQSSSRGNLEKNSSLDDKKLPTSSAQVSSSNRGSSSKGHMGSGGSSRSGSSSRNLNRDGSKSNSRDKSSYDRKRSSKTDSPAKGDNKLMKQNEKSSPKRYSDGALKMSAIPAVPSSNNFRDITIKQGMKSSRNYMRRNRDKSCSPTPSILPLPQSSNSSHDVDFREAFPPLLSTEKRTKFTAIVETTAAAVTNVSTAATTIATIATVIDTTNSTTATTFTTTIKNSDQNTSPIAVATVTSSNSNPEKLEQNLEAASCKDVDLRQFHGNVAPAKTSNTGLTDSINSNAAVPAAANEVSDELETKKRSANTTDNNEEPVLKKSKSEKIDTLFGTEDVDLRKLASSGTQISSSTGMPSTPPPPPIISNESENWAKVKGANKLSRSASSKTKLDDVRAKLAKAARGDKYEKDVKDIKKSVRFNETHEDSEDGTDTNIRTIISQAQEMLESENMDVDQYNTLVKTVIQINETNKLKEAQRRESLLSNKNAMEDLTPISDDEVKFSSDDETGEANLRSSKLKILAKRIPKLSKKDDDKTVTASSSESKFEQSSILKRSPTPTNGGGGGSSYSDTRSSAQNSSKQQSEKRNRPPKETKWSSPWEQQPSATASNSGGNKPKWIMGGNNNNNNNFRPSFPSKLNMANASLLVNRAAVPSPWNNPPSQMIFASSGLNAPTSAPPPPLPPPLAVVNSLLPVEVTTGTPAPPIPPPVLLSSHLSNSVDNPNSDVLRTINIDGVPKEIRFYDDNAIAFMDWDQPKEIGFQIGHRRIIVDDRDFITLQFNDVYNTALIDGKPHQIRFGCPTRELYIDDNWYECYFGDPPIGIFLDGRVRIFKIEGPAPQVRIGNLRQDLVVGKINLIIDALIIIPVFLDAKVQKFEIDNVIHSLQFADCLKTVLIDGIPFDVEYGGLPKSLFLNGIKHFVRFGTLPNGIIPGKVNIQNMIRTDKFKEIELPLISPDTKVQSAVTNQLSLKSLKTTTVNSSAAVDVPNAMLLNNDEKTVEIKEDNLPAAQTVSNLNMDELFQKLLASGILNQNQPVAKNDDSKKDKPRDIPITPVDLSRPETIKTRQSGIIQKLFCGMQCSSCGVRFPPEQTMKYSQHLDWHFRQNRKERDNSRRAHSRKWYYEVTDWIQYEEIEDLEEREKNWFESQLNEMENIDENSNQRTNSPPPSCPAGSDDVDKSCDMCHDKFEQFYNEESEEWHLRGAIRVDEKIYHPLCYEDYKASLTYDETLAASLDTDDNALDSALVKKEKNGIDDDSSTQIIDDDDDDNNDDDEDDVIVLPAEEPSIQEIPDDDDDDDVVIEANELESEILVPDSETNKATKTDDKAKESSEPMESDDVEIQEPHIPFTDLDTYEEAPAHSISTVDDSSQSSQFNIVKIKEEPKDDGYNDDDAFEEVGTIICDDTTQIIDDSPRVTPSSLTIASTTTTAGGVTVHESTQLASIDGNVENQDTPATTVGVNKIKINITKNIVRNESNITTIITQNQQNINTSRTEHVHSPSLPDENATGCNDTTRIIDTMARNYDDYNDSIQFTLKPELENAIFKKVPRTTSGLETSGLCSIM